MNLAIAATGVTFGIVDMGIQALILKTWGHNERKVYCSKILKISQKFREESS